MDKRADKETYKTSEVIDVIERHLAEMAELIEANRGTPESKAAVAELRVACAHLCDAVSLMSDDERRQ